MPSDQMCVLSTPSQAMSIGEGRAPLLTLTRPSPPAWAKAVGKTAGERLKEARRRAGFDSAAAFSRHAGLNETTYQHHENGTRPIRTEFAELYARALKVPAGMILYGEQQHTQPDLAVVGRVSGAGKIEPLSADYDQPVQIALPDLKQLVGHRVLGNDLAPTYRHGDFVFHHPLGQHAINGALLHGRDCLVELPDGTRLLRLVILQADGRFTLIGPQAAPRLDQTLTAAAPVLLVKRVDPTVDPPD